MTSSTWKKEIIENDNKSAYSTKKEGKKSIGSNPAS